MEILNRYLAAQKELYDYFGYVEDWVVIPIEEALDYYWHLEESEFGSGFVGFSEYKEQVLPGIEGDYGDNYYSNDIYTQRFLPKWVYRGKDYTMIVVNTRVDGNKFLQIFNNLKEVK